MSPFKRDTHYQPVAQEDGGDEVELSVQTSCKQTPLRAGRASALQQHHCAKCVYYYLRVASIILMFSSILVTGLIIFAWMQTCPPSQNATAVNDASIAPKLKELSKLFTYKRGYAERPSPETDALWDNMLPAQQGWFQHPDTGGARATFSVFHQLHCLNSIRHGYWALHDAAMGVDREPLLADDSLPMDARPLHFRHCIELLRQALMCRPDLTVEHKNEELGGVTGFGTVHTCMDFGQLVTWTGEWEAFNVTDESRIGQSPQ